jgi:hypothetical protein
VIDLDIFALLPLECFSSTTRVKFDTKLVVMLLMPVVLTIVLLLLAMIGALFTRRQLSSMMFSPRLARLGFWLVLLLYPVFSRTMFATFVLVDVEGRCLHPRLLLHIAASQRAFLPSIDMTNARLPDTCFTLRRRYLYADTSISDDGTWKMHVVLAGIGIVAFSLGIPYVLFCITRSVFAEGVVPSQERVQLVSIMSSSYVPSYWYFESFDLLRKLLNTAVVAAAWQGTMLQLWFAAVAAGLTLFVYSIVQPYQDPLCNRVQAMRLALTLHPRLHVEVKYRVAVPWRSSWRCST